MNPTSACDSGGSVALVEGGSVVLGLPGAPGCTTTGFAGSVWCACALEQKKAVEALAASSVLHNNLRQCFSIRFDCRARADPALR